MAILPPAQTPSPFDTPSRTLLRFAEAFSRDLPVLDAGCGFGRNALALAQSAFDIVCADRDGDRLNQLMRFARSKNIAGRILPVCVDLALSTWPFREACFSAVVLVHFLDLHLLPCVDRSLIPGGHLYLETAGGQGRNYLELPQAGELLSLLSPRFRLNHYQERPVGPPDCNKRAVRLSGQKT